MLFTDVPPRATARKNSNVEGNPAVSTNFLSIMQSGENKWKKENAETATLFTYIVQPVTIL